MRFTSMLKEAIESKTWKELEEGLQKQLMSSVEALLTFKKYPIPNAKVLTKRIKVGNHLVNIFDIILDQCMCSEIPIRISTRLEGLMF